MHLTKLSEKKYYSQRRNATINKRNHELGEFRKLAH